MSALGFIESDGKKLRLGYTTGSCAAGAALASVIFLEEGTSPEFVKLQTPAGIDLNLKVVNPEIKIREGWASAGIIKDSGDDPDVTNGLEIRARVKRRADGKVNIFGGEGVGRLTAKGLLLEPGEKAINPVPRLMIRKSLEAYTGSGYDVEIYVPRGREIAKKTYNSKLGIVDGISILGTKGIVYPMSQDAILKTIELEIGMVKAEYGTEEILLLPGNYGESMRERFGIDTPHVQMSNYIGHSLKYAYDQGFRNFKLLGHIGKFSKLSLGIFNTHSKVCDTRLEAFAYYLYKLGAERNFIAEVESLVTAEEAMNLCISRGYGQVIKAMEAGANEKVKIYLKDETIKVETMIYSMKEGLYEG